MKTLTNKERLKLAAEVVNLALENKAWNFETANEFMSWVENNKMTDEALRDWNRRAENLWNK